MTKQTTDQTKHPTEQGAKNSDESGATTSKGFKRKKSIAAAEAHMLVAAASSSKGPPPFICVPTGPAPNPCLRYGLDPNTGQYNIPPFGELMDCAACRGSNRA